MFETQFDINKDYNNEVIANKKQFITTREIYDNIYTNQLLEVFKVATSFSLSWLLLRLIDNILLDHYKNDKLLYSIILIVCIISLTLIAGKTFTYLKITNDKNKFLQQVTKNN
jgi:hypothetical protein